jgi:hypothetical protein
MPQMQVTFQLPLCNKSFWPNLVLHWRRDRSDLVALEAVRALFGALPTAAPPLFAAAAAAPPAEDARDARCSTTHIAQPKAVLPIQHYSAQRQRLAAVGVSAVFAGWGSCPGWVTC